MCVNTHTNGLPQGPPWRNVRFPTDLLSPCLLPGGGSFLTGGLGWLAMREGVNCELSTRLYIKHAADSTKPRARWSELTCRPVPKLVSATRCLPRSVIAQQGSGRDPAQSVAVLRGTDGLLPALGIDRTTGLAFASVIAPDARFRPPQRPSSLSCGQRLAQHRRSRRRDRRSPRLAVGADVLAPLEHYSVATIAGVPLYSNLVGRHLHLCKSS